MRHKLALTSMKDIIDVASAGTHDYHVGEAPDIRSIKAAERRGYNLRALRARRFTVADFKRYDWVLAMDRGHLAMLERMRTQLPEGPSPQLMTAFSRRYPHMDIPDPYYGDSADFEQVLDMVEEACDCLMEALSSSLAANQARLCHAKRL